MSLIKGWRDVKKNGESIIRVRCNISFSVIQRAITDYHLGHSTPDHETAWNNWSMHHILPSIRRVSGWSS